VLRAWHACGRTQKPACFLRAIFARSFRAASVSPSDSRKRKEVRSTGTVMPATPPSSGEEREHVTSSTALRPRSSRKKRETTMRRTQEMPLVAGLAAGMAVGLAGVALGILLARREGHALRQRVQQAKRPFVSSKVQPSAGGPRQDSDLHMQHLAQQVRQASEQ